jgi:hypothetical protein
MGNKIILSLVLLFTGFLFFLNLVGAIEMRRIEIFGIAFIVFGFTIVLFNIGTGKRGTLFISAGLFIIGCIITFIHNSEIYNYDQITFSAVLITLGSSFLILYFDNPKVKAFLYSAVLLIVFGMLTAHQFNLLGIAQIANRYSNALLNFWQIFVIISLVLILLKKSKPGSK